MKFSTIVCGSGIKTVYKSNLHNNNHVIYTVNTRATANKQIRPGKENFKLS